MSVSLKIHVAKLLIQPLNSIMGITDEESNYIGLFTHLSEPPILSKIPRLSWYKQSISSSLNL